MRRQQYRFKPSASSASLGTEGQDMGQRNNDSPLCILRLKQTQICVPFVADDFTARETADRDQHHGTRTCKCQSIVRDMRFCARLKTRAPTSWTRDKGTSAPSERETRSETGTAKDGKDGRHSHTPSPLLDHATSRTTGGDMSLRSTVRLMMRRLSMHSSRDPKVVSVSVRRSRGWTGA